MRRLWVRWFGWRRRWYKYPRCKMRRRSMREVSEAEKRESRRSSVRVWVTYGAATFLFGGGIGLVAACLFMGDHDKAKDVFMAILPISTAVVTYWFANRASSKNVSNGIDSEPQPTTADETEPSPPASQDRLPPPDKQGVLPPPDKTPSTEPMGSYSAKSEETQIHDDENEQ